MTPLNQRVAFGLMVAHFGIPCTVTRPDPDDGPVVTTGVWGPPLLDEAPFGRELRRREPSRVFTVTRSATLLEVPRESIITAPEDGGTVDRTWRVVGLAGLVTAEEIPLIVMPASDVID